MALKDAPDMRTLAEIPFASDVYDSKVGNVVRAVYAQAGLETAQAIIDAGCTGLAHRLLAYRAAKMAHPDMLALALKDAFFARSNHSGAGFGLPCRVPPTHFCLIHNTIGGLQQGQRAGTPEELRFAARPLTADEAAHAQMIDGKVKGDAAAEAKQFFGLEEVVPEVVAEAPALVEVPPKRVFAPPKASPREVYTTPSQELFAWECPEHKETNWHCRYCLASAIVHGPLEPNVYLELESNSGAKSLEPLIKLGALLHNANSSARVSACVVAAEWNRELVRRNFT
jgi:hypothetical protein